MKVNQDIAVSGRKCLLVPYERHHVPKYHSWMQDPAILAATASDQLTLDEELENQQSWRESSDKLTFIVCQPVEASVAEPGVCDAPDKMVGDVNLFLYPAEDGDEDDPAAVCVGEVDIMIAEQQCRGVGLGKAVVTLFLTYIHRNLDAILGEYGLGTAELKTLMAKISKDNAASIALFRSLGFEQEGEANYFGEVKLVMDDWRARFNAEVGDYEERQYAPANDA
ncbi:GNAT domain-containing protein [Schizothecium vesticola]|uniref:GNAT domain-containing protein n=1 Tax=Schizothecium vesticola TaxID=314040 RepID=A0AA40F6M4_9PEZI|nr:GNAT domain-containing protein [Schizothecium vesticola]